MRKHAPHPVTPLSALCGMTMGIVTTAGWSNVTCRRCLNIRTLRAAEMVDAHAHSCSDYASQYEFGATAVKVERCGCGATREVTVVRGEWV